MIRLALDMLKASCATKLARKMIDEGIPEIHKLLRQFAKPSLGRDKSDLSYIVAQDSDVNKATSITDMSADDTQSAYEFQLYDKEGVVKNYKFAVYKLSFEPDDSEKIRNSLAEVKGELVDLSKEEISQILGQGKADKFVAGIENTEDTSEKFNYTLLGLEPPESKPSFVLDYDSDGKNVSTTNQMSAVKGDYANYVEQLKIKVDKYNQDMSGEINQKQMPEGSAVPPPPGGMPPPPMDMGGGTPPMPMEAPMM